MLMPCDNYSRNAFNDLPEYVFVKVLKDTRSTEQNALLWVWNNEIQKHMAEHFGQMASAEQWHDVLVAKLMPAEIHVVELPDGTRAKVGRMRTSKMSKAQMSEYMEKLAAYCAETLGLVLSSWCYDE